MISRSRDKTRFTMRDTSMGLEIVIPSRCPWYGFLGMTIWVFVWLGSQVLVLGLLLMGSDLSENESFLVVWFLAWTPGGLYAIYICLWQLTGLMIIRVTPASLTIKRDIFGKGREREFRLVSLYRLRVDTGRLGPSDPMSFGQRAWPPVGALAFDYKNKSHRFGLNLDVSEAETIVARIKDQFQIPD